MSEAPDPYRVLGVAPDAGAQEIRSAYVRLMKRQFAAGSSASLPADRIRLMQDAYACLRDPGRRADHDLTRARRESDHAEAVSRRQRRLRAYDRRHPTAKRPAPPAPHWRPAAILAVIGCVGVAAVACFCL